MEATRFNAIPLQWVSHLIANKYKPICYNTQAWFTGEGFVCLVLCKKKMFLVTAFIKKD